MEAKETNDDTDPITNFDFTPITKARKTYCKKHCTAIIRLSHALKYYSLLEPKYNQTHQDLLVSLIKDKYPDLLNDFIHLKDKHDAIIHKFKDMAIKNGVLEECDYQKCDFATRHHDGVNERDNDTISMDPICQVYAQVLDSLHFYLFHSVDAGLRFIRPNKSTWEQQINEIKKSDDNNNPYFDAEIAMMNKLLSTSTDKRRSFNRWSQNNGKFSISVEKPSGSRLISKDKAGNQIEKKENEVNEAGSNSITEYNEAEHFESTIHLGVHLHIQLRYEPEQNVDYHDHETYLEKVYAYLQKNGIDEEDIQKLRIYLQAEEFDTEAARIDVAIASGNIMRLRTKSSVTDHMKNMFELTQRMSCIHIIQIGPKIINNPVSSAFNIPS